MPDVEHIYQVPQLLENQSLVQKILARFQLDSKKKPEMDIYYRFPEFHKELKTKKQHKIGIFGKYMKNKVSTS